MPEIGAHTNKLNAFLVELTNRPPDQQTVQMADRLASHHAGLGLMSGRMLMEQMGAPPLKDIRILGLTIKTNSKEYDEALTALQTYHMQLANYGDLRFEVFDTIKDSLAAELGRVIAAADAYADRHAGSATKADRVAVMTALKEAAERELDGIARLSQAEFPHDDEMMVDEAVALARAGLEKVQLFHEDMNDFRLNKQRTQDDFAGGAINSVSKVVYRTSDGLEEIRITKPLMARNDHLSDGEEAIGVDPENTRVYSRNKASEAAAGLLGMQERIPQSDLLMHNGHAVLAMKLAPGEDSLGYVEEPLNDAQVREVLTMPQEDLSRHVYQNAEGVWVFERNATRGLPVAFGDKPALTAALQEQLLDLQMLDCLCGQVDRHLHNIFIRIDGDKVIVTGIDNDMSFGRLTRDIEHRSEPGLRNGNYAGPPPMMSEAAYERLMKLDPETFATSISTGLSTAEVDAAVIRLDQLKKHASDLRKQGLVVEDFATWTGVHPKTGKTVNASEYLVGASAPSSYIDSIHHIGKGCEAQGFIAGLSPEKHGQI